MTTRGATRRTLVTFAVAALLTQDAWAGSPTPGSTAPDLTPFGVPGAAELLAACLDAPPGASAPEAAPSPCHALAAALPPGLSPLAWNLDRRACDHGDKAACTEVGRSRLTPYLERPLASIEACRLGSVSGCLDALALEASKQAGLPFWPDLARPVIQALACSDGHWLSCSALDQLGWRSDLVRAVRWTDLRPTAELGRGVRSLAFSPSGDLVLLGGHAWTVVDAALGGLLDAPELLPAGRLFPAGAGPEVNALSVDASGTTLALVVETHRPTARESGGTGSVASDAPLAWDVRSGATRPLGRPLVAPPGPLATRSQDGLVAEAVAGGLRLRTRAGDRSWTVSTRLPAPPALAAFSLDGHRLAVLVPDRYLAVLDLAPPPDGPGRTNEADPPTDDAWLAGFLPLPDTALPPADGSGTLRLAGSPLVLAARDQRDGAWVSASPYLPAGWLSLPAGEYVAHAQLAGRCVQELPVTVAASRATFASLPEPAQGITARLVDAKTRLPLVGGRARVECPPDPALLRTAPAEDSSDAQGRLQLVALPTGTHTVTMSAPGYAPVQLEAEVGTGVLDLADVELLPDGIAVADAQLNELRSDEPAPPPDDAPAAVDDAPGLAPGESPVGGLPATRALGYALALQEDPAFVAPAGWRAGLAAARRAQAAALSAGGDILRARYLGVVDALVLLSGDRTYVLYAALNHRPGRTAGDDIAGYLPSPDGTALALVLLPRRQDGEPSMDGALLAVVDTRDGTVRPMRADLPTSEEIDLAWTGRTLQVRTRLGGFVEARARFECSRSGRCKPLRMGRSDSFPGDGVAVTRGWTWREERLPPAGLPIPPGADPREIRVRPDGRFVSYLVKDSLAGGTWVLDTMDGRSRRLVPNYWGAPATRWAANGDLLFDRREMSNVTTWRIDPATGAASPLAGPATLSLDARPQGGPDRRLGPARDARWEPAVLPEPGAPAGGHLVAWVGDPIHLPHAGTKVTLTPTLPGPGWTAVTAPDGRARFDGLPEGDYTLGAASDGFAPAEALPVTIRVERTSTAYVSLRPGSPDRTGIDAREAVGRYLVARECIDPAALDKAGGSFDGGLASERCADLEVLSCGNGFVWGGFVLRGSDVLAYAWHADDGGRQEWGDQELFERMRECQAAARR